MIGFQTFIRVLAITFCVSAVGGAYILHRTIVTDAVNKAQARASQRAHLEIRKRRKSEIARIIAQAAADRARVERSRALTKELANDQSIDDTCIVSGDALRLLDTVGADPPASP